MEEHEAIAEVRHAITHKILPNIYVVQKCLDYLIIYIFEKLSQII